MRLFKWFIVLLIIELGAGCSRTLLLPSDGGPSNSCGCAGSCCDPCGGDDSIPFDTSTCTDSFVDSDTTLDGGQSNGTDGDSIDVSSDGVDTVDTVDTDVDSHIGTDWDSDVVDGGETLDADGDGYSVDTDCDDLDPNNWVSCTTCVDADSDGFWISCDRFLTIKGPDCDDLNQQVGHCVKNIILVVPDGMGQAAVDATRMYATANTKPLFFETLPKISEIITSNAALGITDSAAGSTAMATGQKVNNSVISLAIPGDGEPLPTVLERHQASGKSTGLVTIKDSVLHATPAAFMAHAESRTNYKKIAYDLLNASKPNVLLGHSTNYLLTEDLVAAGYTVVSDDTSLFDLDVEAENMVYGGFDGDMPSLTERTAVALAILDNDPDGFFLLVEQAKIDKAAHANDLYETIVGVLELDQTVTMLVEWAQTHSSTLIIVAPDHETGGLFLTEPDPQVGVVPEHGFATTGHTGVNVPLYAIGPCVDSIPEVVENTEIHDYLLFCKDTVLEYPANHSD